MCARPRPASDSDPGARGKSDGDDVPAEPSLVAAIGARAGFAAGLGWRALALRAGGAVIALAVAVMGLRYWVWSLHHESTDDAFIDVHVVRVSPRVAGRVQRVLVADNQPVEAGNLLVQLDPRDFQVELDDAEAARAAASGRLAAARAQVGVAEAARAQAEAEVVAARAASDNAAADLARYRASERGAVSRQSIDAASTAAARTAAQLVAKQKAVAAAAAQVELARAQIDASAADLAAAQARVAQAALQLSYTQVRAAEAGRVTSKAVAPGDYVQVGQQLFALVPRRVWVTANFKETQLRRMRPGQAAVIHVDAYDRDFRGRVDSVQAGSGAAFSLLPPENATGNYVKIVQRVPVKIVFEDDGVDSVVLGPGMSVEPTVDVR